MSPNDEIRNQMLRYFYERNASHAHVDLKDYVSRSGGTIVLIPGVECSP